MRTSVSIFFELSTGKTLNSEPGLIFARLPDISPDEIIAHMSNPRVAQHMPLLTFKWDRARVADFVGTKEDCWRRDGLGHWAILHNGAYIGWGGFQKEGDEWDFGLVLRPDAFGQGMRISRKALEFARADQRIPYVTFLLAPSRKHLGALTRFGARFVTQIKHEGATFLKYRLDTK